MLRQSHLCRYDKRTVTFRPCTVDYQDFPYIFYVSTARNNLVQKVSTCYLPDSCPSKIFKTRNGMVGYVTCYELCVFELNELVWGHE